MSTDYGRVRYSATSYLFVLLVIAALGFGSKAYPQSKSTTAALSGTVSDPSGARVPKATVKLTNPDERNYSNRHHDPDG